MSVEASQETPSIDKLAADAVRKAVDDLNHALRSADRLGLKVELDLLDVTVYGDTSTVFEVIAHIARPL